MRFSLALGALLRLFFFIGLLFVSHDAGNLLVSLPVDFSTGFPQVFHMFMSLFHSVEFLSVLGLTDRNQTCKPAKLIS
jgi:hypothetical protein